MSNAQKWTFLSQKKNINVSILYEKKKQQKTSGRPKVYCIGNDH